MNPFVGSGITWPDDVVFGPHSFYGTHPVPTAWPSSCAGESSCSVGSSACTFAGNFTVPAHETLIPKYAFAYCSDLVGIVGMAGVTSIGDYAFHKSGLTGNFAWPVG